LAEFVKQTRAAFPDLEFVLGAAVEEGDEVWAHVTINGTHRGEFLGVPGTGKKVSVPAIDRIRVREGKAVEHWGVTDVMSMMEQLGVVPPGP
jgi:predicted ester cyclase